MFRSRLPAPALLLLALLASPVDADEGPQEGNLGLPSARPLAAPGAAPWQPMHFPRISRHTAYSAAGDAVEARSECSASAWILRLDPPIDLRELPLLRWRWQLLQTLAGDADERAKGGDDFAARVYALFDFDAEHSTLWKRTQRRIGSVLYGEGLPGKAISYVWAQREQRGRHWPNPYSADTAVAVLQSGARAGWQSETVDLRADYERLLGPVRTKLMAIALMTDSDDTCQSAAAAYAGFELLPRSEPPSQRKELRSETATPRSP